MKKKIYSAFTLAEMMVVMLILSIIMAAFAPVMTTRSKTDRTSPWRYATNNSDIYFGLGDNQTAMIGQPNKVNDTDSSSRLIINTSDDTQKHIVFKRGQDNLLGSLFLTSSSVLLGDGSTQGSNNVAIGIGALKNSNTSYNTALGALAGSELTNSSYTTSVGYNAQATGTNSTAIGYNSEAHFLSVALGQNAKAIAPSDNSSAVGVAIGNNAKSSNVAALAVGSEAKASGVNSIAIAQQAQASAENAIAIGHSSKTTGIKSTALGGNSLASGSYSVAIGYKSKAEYTESIAIGDEANTKSSNAVAIGYGAAAHGSSVAVGKGALKNTENTDNVAIGYETLYNSTSGSENTAIGRTALRSNTSGRGNVAIGKSAAYINSSGSENIAIGGEYSYNATGTGTIYGTLGSNQTGDHNIAIGVGALPRSTGNNNIAIGAMACENVTGTNKICIGNHSGPGVNNPDNDNDEEHIYIGSASKGNTGGAAVLEVHNPGGESGSYHKSAVVINGNLVVNGLMFSSNRRGGGGPWEHTDQGDDNGHSGHIIHWNDAGGYYSVGSVDERKRSDRRLKYVGSEVTTGLDKIKQLRVFNYTFKKDEKKTPHVGVIAQDLQKVFPDAVKKDDDGFLTIRWDDMFYALINAVKELDAKVTQLIKKDSDKGAKIKALEAKNAELEARLKRLEAKIK